MKHLSTVSRQLYKLQYTQLQRQYITFNASSDDDDTHRHTAKPLESNFVFRLYQELGKKSQDRQAQESLGISPTLDESSTTYFRTHDRPAHRLFGIYYKMANSEISSFLKRGFGLINHLMHPMIDAELPLFHETVDGIFTKQIEFDFKKCMENSKVVLNLDIGHLRDENSGGTETKISENVSIWLPPIYKPKVYHQQYSIIRNVGNRIKELKGNYFEYRGLSIAKQLFMHLIRSNEISNDMLLLSDDVLIIDAHNFWESLEAETIEFPTPQLVSICDLKPEQFMDKQQKPYLICVLAIQNSILTLKKREFDPNNIPPNIPLSGGSALLVDPNIYSQILYWRRTNDPATFFVNAYGEKL